MKPNSKSQAGTAADSSTKDDVNSVSQHNAKPNVVCSPNVVPTESILDKIVRPNLNPYPHSPLWKECRRLQKRPLAVFVRFCLDSVSLMPLVRSTFLFRVVSTFYNRLIEPSRKSFDKEFQAIVNSGNEVQQSGQKKYEAIL